MLKIKVVVTTDSSMVMSLVKSPFATFFECLTLCLMFQKKKSLKTCSQALHTVVFSLKKCAICQV